MIRKTMILGTVAMVAALAAAPASAENVLRWAQQGDALTMDRHAQNEGPTSTLMQQIYDSLLLRNNDLQLEPGLATEWSIITEPHGWEFKLREGVTFHDGAPFNADDVVFSINRALNEISDFKSYLSAVTEVVKVDDYTVRLLTDGPAPLLEQGMASVQMMDEEWSVANGVETPQDFAAGEETFAVRNTNGTGPFMMVSREPDVRTELVKNPDWWGSEYYPHEADRIVRSTITSPATRVAALLSGELDFVLDPPVQDLGRLEGEDAITVATTPENRVIFFGMDMGSDDNAWDTVEGANPFADLRVRQAFAMAIDADAIQRVVMRGQSTPAGMISPPFVNGYTPELDERVAVDLDAARGLLAAAGYADGFGVTLHCPNDRYVNDEAICEAAVGMLGQIGIDVTLISRTRSIHFAELQNREVGFYMLGWGVPTYDSEYVFNFLFHSDDGNRGTWNATGFSDARVDELTAAMVSEADLDARNAMIAEVWNIVDPALPYIPVHHQVINWAMSSGVDVPVRGDNSPRMEYATFGQ